MSDTVRQHKSRAPRFQPRPTPRRQGTRAAIVRVALREV